MDPPSAMKDALERLRRSHFVALRRSHFVISRCLRPPIDEIDELIFLEFRWAPLKPQKRVYAAMPSYECQICMYGVYGELLAVQHNPRHPPVCVRCYARMTNCPFCRKPLMLTSRSSSNTALEVIDVERVLEDVFRQRASEVTYMLPSRRRPGDLIVPRRLSIVPSLRDVSQRRPLEDIRLPHDDDEALHG